MSSEKVTPVVVKVGRTKKRDLQALESGEGRLAEVVAEAVNGAIAEHPNVDRDEVLPVVIVYEEKPKRRRRPGWLPFIGL